MGAAPMSSFPIEADSTLHGTRWQQIFSILPTSARLGSLFPPRLGEGKQHLGRSRSLPALTHPSGQGQGVGIATFLSRNRHALPLDFAHPRGDSVITCAGVSHSIPFHCNPADWEPPYVSTVVGAKTSFSLASLTHDILIVVFGFILCRVLFAMEAPGLRYPLGALAVVTVQGSPSYGDLNTVRVLGVSAAWDVCLVSGTNVSRNIP